MKIAILTLGCKVNQAESQEIEKTLGNYGYSMVDLSENPDFCIVNTCTVTSKSDYQSRQLIRKAHKSGARVIVTGCYTELNKNIVKLMGCFVKVQDGCNNSCSYCTIPQARGRSTSSTLVDVITRVNEAVTVGFNEIVLTGIHLGCYGIDLKPKVKLSDLISTILNQTKISRIRLSSIELNEVDEKLLELMKDARLCKHIHIPLQSGDDEILKLMNRHYSCNDYRLCIEKIAKDISSVTIGTDVIVGFLGEGENEFNNTYNLLKDLPISYMHAFPYSPRPNTTAFSMKETADFDTKKKRVSKIFESSVNKKKENMSRHINKELDVLIESVNKDGMCRGTSGNYLKVLVYSNKISRGSIVNVNIKGLQDDNMLYGMLA